MAEALARLADPSSSSSSSSSELNVNFDKLKAVAHELGVPDKSSSFFACIVVCAALMAV